MKVFELEQILKIKKKASEQKIKEILKGLKTADGISSSKENQQASNKDVSGQPILRRKSLDSKKSIICNLL